jgi:AcrR family transcriptional regulator
MSVSAPSLRERQQDLTRRLITEGLARVILRTGIHEFSVQEVADEAGVSLRTLYRHFPNREDLLESLGVEVEQMIRDGGLDTSMQPVSAKVAADVVGDLFMVLGGRTDLARAWVIANMTTGFKSEARRSHDLTILRVVRTLGPHLDEAEQRRLYAVIRCLAGSLSWKVMTADLGLSDEEAAAAAGWALRTLLEEIESGGRPVLPES